eukprot:441198-Pelagomonas_calceolata.AAC.1
MAAAKRGRTGAAAGASAAAAESPAPAAAAGGDETEGCNGEASEPRVCVWAEDPAAESQDASSDAMWRRIHKIISKRRQRGGCGIMGLACGKQERARARAAEARGGAAGHAWAEGPPAPSSSSPSPYFHQHHHRSQRRRYFTGSREDKRMLFWDFLTDL